MNTWCSADSIQWWPEVAFDSDSGTYLVIWTDWRNDYGNRSNSDIYGQCVSRNGALLDDLTTPEDESEPMFNFIISNADNNQGTWRDSWWVEEYGGISAVYSTNDSH